MSSRDKETWNSILPPLPLTVYHLVLGTMWASAFVPEARLWGINWYRYFGWPGLAVLLPWVIDRWSQRAEQSQTSETGNRKYLVTALVTVILFGLGFVLLAGRTHFLGDGYQVLGKVQAGAEVIKPWDNAVWTVQKVLYLLLGGAGDTDAQLALRILSIGSGILMLAALFTAARKLFDDNLARMFFVLSLATGGYMLLFFGYVENYPLFILLVTLFGLSGLLVCRAGWPRWAVLLPLSVAVVLHPFGVVLVPPALYLFFRESCPGRLLTGWPVSLKLAGLSGMLLAALCVLVYYWQHSYFFRFSLVPPMADQFTVEGYTLFSANHILDYANLLIMLCPGLPLALVILTRLPVRSILRRPEYRFLGLFAVATLAIVFVFNPRLGMPRDWDLFAFAGIPMMMLSSLVVLDRWGDNETRTGGWLIIVLGLLVLGPRAVSQAVPEVSIAVFDHFADLDVIKSRNGRFLLQEYLERHDRVSEHARRARINAVVLPHERLAEEARQLGDQGYLTEAMAKLKQAIVRDPTYYYAWSNLGVIYRWLEQYDSSLICLHIADGLNPYSYSINMKLAGAYLGAGDDTQAEAHWWQAARLKPEDLECRLYLLRLYRQQSRWVELDVLLREVVTRDSLSLEILEPVARRQLEVGDTAAGAASCRQAMKLGLDTAVIVLLQQEFPQLQVIDRDWTDSSDSTGQ